MVDAHEFLRNLALVLGTAAATTLLCRRFHLPVVFGYLAAGMIVGPYVPIPVMADEAMVRTLSELGVILLMFALGLEFSLQRLLRVGRTAGFVAVLQSSVLIAVGYLLGRAFGWTAMESLYAGAVIAISSTTIIVRAFAEQGIRGRVTEIVFAILIIEDLVAILLLAIFTTVSTGADLTVGGVALTAGRLAAFLIVLAVAGLLLVPRLFRYLARLGQPETMVVTGVAVAFGAAYLADSFGYSVALGAFLAGAIVAESGVEERVTTLIQPVRDMFAAIFFVAVGMLIDPKLVAEYWLPILILTVAVIVGKVVAVTVGAFLTGYGVRISVQAGMSLAQIGEFSFIIAGVGLATGATGQFLYPIAVAVAAITTLTTPWLIRSAGPVASFVDRKLPPQLQTVVGLYETWMVALRNRVPDEAARSRQRRTAGLLAIDAIVIAGIVTISWLSIGRATSALSGTFGLTAEGAWGVLVVIAGLAVAPFAVALVRHARVLIQAAAARALPDGGLGKLDRAVAPRRALMVTWQLAIVTLIAIPLIALVAPVLSPLISSTILALILAGLGVLFWRSATNLQGHAQAGAEVIIAAMARQMAGKDHGPPATELGPVPDDRASLAKVYELLPGLGEPVPVRIGPGDYAAGRSLGELDLRDATGATVLVVIRQSGEQVALPVGRERLLAGDLLALAGTAHAVDRAKTVIAFGPEPGARPTGHRAEQL
jgi:CPA2 family monovalent cation:H+ antiporter-2